MAKESLKLTTEEAKWWWETIRTHKEIYKPRHKLWSNLIRIYDLDVDVPGASGRGVKVSRFYPIMKQLIAGAAFHYPKISIQADEGTVEGASEVLEQAAEDALEITDARSAIQQALFNAGFCSIGWLKFFYNPPGDDASSPYVATDAQQEDFAAIDVVNPFYMYVDRMVRPHSFKTARFTFEEIYVPLDIFKEDPRYERVAEVKATIPNRDDLGGFELDIAGDMSSYEDLDQVLEVMQQGKYVRLYEVHDRLKRRIITFAHGVLMPVETSYHPFARVESVFQPGMDGKQQLVGFKRAPGFLCRHGFPYHPVRLDLHPTQFYPMPPLYYIKDPQRVIMNSLTRREDLLERYKRIILAPKRELQMDPTLEGAFKEADDGSVVGVQDPRAFVFPNWGDPPVDQLGLEADMRQYEAQIMRIDAGDAGPASTPATNRSLDQIPTTLNREWIKANVVLAYKITLDTFFSMFGDPRYFPDDFAVSLGGEDQQLKFQTLTQQYFRLKYKLTIHADSLEPFRDQLEKDSTILWFDRVLNLPETNRTEALLRFHRAFRQPNPERLLQLSPDVDAIKASQLETVGFLMQGQDPGVRPGEKHKIHMENHSQLKQFPQFQQLPPERQELAMEATRQHMESHVQMMQQEMGGQGGGQMGPRPGGSQPKTDGKLLQGPGRFIQTVQSNAQRVAQTATNEPSQGIAAGPPQGGF